MNKVNLWSFYVTGHTLHRLTDFWNISGLVRQEKHIIAAILSQANEVLAFLIANKSVQLASCRKAAYELTQLINDATALVFEDKESDTALNTVLIDISLKAQQFETILAHELPKLETFFVPQKGTHSTSDLLEHAVNNLSAKVRVRLTPEAVNDINAAGRCLAFDMPTASGFHILRAVESLIRAYHFKLTGSALAVKSRNWGTYIKSLNSHGADKKVTGYLEHIKDFYRNPIVHPEVTLTPDEAFSLFGASLSAITMLDSVM